jgi:hypothetical protein
VPCYHISTNHFRLINPTIGDIYIVQNIRLEKARLKPEPWLPKPINTVSNHGRHTLYFIFHVRDIQKNHIVLISDSIEYGSNDYAIRKIPESRRKILSDEFTPYQILEIPKKEAKWLNLKRVITYV